MAFDLGARQYALENTILGHPIYKNALRDLWASAARARNGPMEGRARILIGGSGDGKTRLLRKMVSEPWAQSDLTGKTEDIIPVKYVEVPSRVTPRELVKTLLEAFGEQASARQSAEDIIDDLVPLFQGVGLRLLLLDEAHWLMKSKSQEVREANAEFLKSLLNRTGVSIVLAGMEELDLLHNRFHTQMRRRLLGKIVLRPYRWASVAERKWFIAILKKYENAIDLPKPSGLGEVEIARRLYLVSRGSLGVVVQYLNNALEIADARRGSSITREDLSAAHIGLSMCEPLNLGGDMDKFEEDEIDHRDDPFLSSEVELKALWTETFMPPDLSRKTKLASKMRT